MANDNLASIDCDIPIRGGTIRMKSKGRYKYYLYTEKFGPQFFNTDEGQQFLISHMREMGEPKPEPVKPEPKPQPKPEPEKKEKGILDW